MATTKNAIVLCSGGLDSVVTAHYVKKSLDYKNLVIMFFDYGQKSLSAERKASKKCASDLGAEFMEVKLSWLKGISTSLINNPGKVKKLSREDLKDTSEESEKYYVPCRNSLFITYALALADSYYIKSGKKEKYDIFLGFKCEGKESYPDTTEKFVKEMNRLSSIGCSEHFKVIAPLIKKDKEDIVLLGKKLGVELEKTFSCYVGKWVHCGGCLACKLRQEGFYWSGLVDSTKYIE